MPSIDETPLPGVGLRQDFACRSGSRVGVITRPSGRRELIVYDPQDPDAVRSSVDLSPDESSALSELLGGTTVTRQVEHLGEGIIPGLSIDWVPIPADRPAGSIGDLGIRTRTGASVVAVVHDNEPIPAPGPELVLHPGDTAILVGTADGIAAATRLLESGSPEPSPS
jgi:TrkA domain protein